MSNLYSSAQLKTNPSQDNFLLYSFNQNTTAANTTNKFGHSQHLNARQLPNQKNFSDSSFNRQGSNDSNYSGPSSGGDFSYEEAERNKISRLNPIPSGSSSANLSATATASRNRVDNKPHQQRSQDAKQEIELCRTKPVLFAVRTNVSYEPSKEHNAPVPMDMIVSFDVKDYLHIKHVS
ncbi:voltage-dependent L-type calcium channel subunit beta-2 isoform X4 [Brachionus plicatilis]|uniref:Voltage-dependent L-type calcium channel subunit beta-2 isoform X4 n=1 Tax=Brachionus plicatilis TaxID=10195 RepID=A0A3M7RUD8_BRAPC|nr:voltage-dependent L-type calcium channel subunit beta-2 isoform X4 [Brachionus plicatilis]